MTHYKCVNCEYTCKLFSDIVKHLNRQVICKKTLKSYNYTDEEIIKLSLIPCDNEIHNYDIRTLRENFRKIKNTLCKKKFFEQFNIIEKNKLRICPLCNASYTKKNDLKNHLILYCVNIDTSTEEKDDITSNIINIGNNNNVNINNNNNNNNVHITSNDTNNININNVYPDKPCSFDDNWDVSHLSSHEKTVLIISMFKYTRTLESLLRNKNNHNVIIDKKSKSGIVYKNNKFEIMDYNEICDRSFEKLDFHINSFINEILNNNNYGIDVDYIEHNKKVHRRVSENFLKYRPNINDNIEKFKQCNMLLNTYDSVKDDTIKKFNEIEKINDNLSIN